MKSGNGRAPGPGRAKAARVGYELQEGNMADALTSEDMSPELLKVAETSETRTRRTVPLAGASDR